MAKNNDKEFEEMMKMMLDHIQGDENANKALGGMYDVALELMNAQFYRYQRPDYTKDYDNMLPAWLGPIWNAQHDDPIRILCEFVANDGKDIPNEQKHKDIKKYLCHLFDSYDRDDDNSVWKLYGIYWEMEHFGIKDIDLVLEALRQDAYFVSHYTLGAEDAMLAALYQNADGNLDKLKEFMYSQGFVPIGKQMVFSAIVVSIMFHPEQRLSIVSWLMQYLNHCYDICMQGAYAGNIEHYVRTLAQFGITEAMPTIEKIVKGLDIPFFEYTNDLKAIRKDMNTPLEKFPEYELTLDYLADQWDETQKDKKDDEPLMPPDFWDDDEEESGLYDVSYPLEKYDLGITWDDYKGALNPVSVRLTVPSSIFLNQLAKLIMLAFNRNDLPTWYFVDKDGNICTMPQSRVGRRMKKAHEVYEDASFYSLSDILDDEDNELRFCLNFPEKDHEKDWTHTITLLKSGSYGAKTGKLVRIEEVHGAYPPKSVKHADDYIAKYSGKVPKAPDIKAIRKAIDKWVKEVE